jgi:glycosyltransferase involved in cell wall biosynthesis
MRIAIDARELCHRPTGVGRYLAELLIEWAGHPEARRHEWLIYAHRPPSVPPTYRSAVRVLPGAGGTRWEQWTLSRTLASDRPDVLFSPAYTAPLFAPCPIVLAVHDVSFAAHPEWFAVREGLRRRFTTRWAARRAKTILTISEFSRSEIGRLLSIGGNRVRVIYPGMRSLAAGARAREPMVLYVGSIFARRHVDRLIRVFAERVAPVLPAATLEIDRVVAQLPAALGNRVRLRSYVDDETLGDLYSRASVFTFLSEYEGFGLTPLEALAAGVPPLVLDTPVAREVHGQAAQYLRWSPGIDEPLAEALALLLTNEAARREILEHAPEVLARYRWDRAAALTLESIEEAGGA